MLELLESLVKSPFLRDSEYEKVHSLQVLADMKFFKDTIPFVEFCKLHSINGIEGLERLIAYSLEPLESSMLEPALAAEDKLILESESLQKMVDSRYANKVKGSCNLSAKDPKEVLNSQITPSTSYPFRFEQTFSRVLDDFFAPSQAASFPRYGEDFRHSNMGIAHNELVPLHNIRIRAPDRSVMEQLLRTPPQIESDFCTPKETVVDKIRRGLQRQIMNVNSGMRILQVLNSGSPNLEVAMGDSLPVESSSSVKSSSPSANNLTSAQTLKLEPYITHNPFATKNLDIRGYWVASYEPLAQCKGAGLYCVINCVSGRAYYGQTDNLVRRGKEHMVEFLMQIPNCVQLSVATLRTM